MPRVRDKAARKEQKRQEADRDEKVYLAELKMDAALLKADQMGRRHMEEVDRKIKFIRDTTDRELLRVKWSDFLTLKVDNFADHQGSVSTRIVALRSRSVSRKPAERIRSKQPTWTRVQSVDREKMDEIPTLSFRRWPRAGEAGSPLALPKPWEEERCANGQIPTSKEVITVKPHKMMKQVKREMLMTLDQNSLVQVKTLTANLDKIVNMASKMEKF